MASAFFTGPTVSNIRIVIKMAEVKHQAQVAPMTKGSRKVKYIEKRVPKMVNANKDMTDRFAILPLENRASSQDMRIAMYPNKPSTPIGRMPKRRAYSLCCTVLQSPTGPQTAVVWVVSTYARYPATPKPITLRNGMIHAQFSFKDAPFSFS